MRNLTTILIASMILIACGGGNKKSVSDIIADGDLKKIKEKRAEIVTAQKTVLDELRQLDEAIAKLDTQTKLPLVTIINAKEEDFHHYLELQGNVATKKNIVLYPEFSGILEAVYVTKGQKVQKGQLLAKISDGGLSQQVAQLKIQANLAKTTYERQERLWNQKIGSEIQYLQTKSNYEAQQKAVNQLNSQLAKTTIKAPFSGTIDNIITEQGAVAVPGSTPIIRIINLDNMYIETAVPEKYLMNISAGKEVKVTFPVLGKTIDSKIRQVGNYIDTNNRTFMVEVDVPNKNKAIKPNLTAKLKINDYTNPKAILIPQSIISENAAGEQYVYITSQPNKDGLATAKRIIINTGKTQGDLIEVLSGLKNGDMIVKEGARSVQDGQKVEIIKA